MNVFSQNKVIAKNINEETVEDQVSDATNEVLNDIDFDALEEVVSDLGVSESLFAGMTFKEFVLSLINGEEVLSFDDISMVFCSRLKLSIKKILLPLSLILVIVLLCNLFNKLKNNKISGVSEIIYLICFSVVVLIVVYLTKDIIDETKHSLLKLQKQMNSLFPILLSLMGVMGGVASVKAFSPMFLFLSTSIANIFIYILLPMFVMSLILSILGNISSNTKLNKLNSFVFSLFRWVIGVVFAVFMGFMSIKGVMAGASDGISIKAAKYAIKNYIPMLGGYISDGFELVKAGGLIVKNATGVAGLVLVIGTIIGPVISIAILQLGLKLLAGIVEPVGDSKSSSLLYSVGKSLKLLVVVLVGVSLMYFFSVFLTMCSISNIL